jgi:hypothetical protein
MKRRKSRRRGTAGIISSLKRPELIVTDGSGHLPNLGAEARFNDALLALLHRHAPSAVT